MTRTVGKSIEERLRPKLHSSAAPISVTHKNIARQWHPTKNADLTPDLVTYGSTKKIWWQCPAAKDHVWQSAVKNRTSSKNTDSAGCPFCAGQRVCKSNSLATTFPKIAKEWHSAKNGQLSPIDVVPGSDLKVWWQCSENKEHIWQSLVYNRTYNGSGCPYCSNKKASKENSLASIHPDLAAQWHPTMNKALSPSSIPAGSGKTVWWRCNQGKDHIWQARIVSRTLLESGCPYCAGRRVSKSNSLAVRYPEIAKQWHPTKNKELTARDVTPGQHKKIWWQCTSHTNHVWRMDVHTRTQSKGNCPFCLNMR
jgi:DNA-directed RNA polymerase subunit RPC12/RpoP